MEEKFKKDTPIDYNIVSNRIKGCGLEKVGKASIREIKRLIDNIEKESGKKFIRMEMGIPGLKACPIGIEAEKKALDNGVASQYPDIGGISVLKQETSRFLKSFINIDVSPESCIPTVGSMQASFAAFMTLDRMYEDRDTTLFIDPGFPVHKQQIKVLRQKFESFDVYNYRGDKLKDKLESYLKKGNIHSLLYSNPNNPSWICFTEKELQIIGELANKYNVIIIEDLAYFGMDFRRNISTPGKAPFQVSVANYTDNYILLISSSKAFSYAGQRVGMMVVSDKLFNVKASGLKRFYSSEIFGNALLFGTVYSLSAGVSHSVQYGLAAILKASNDGEYNFRSELLEYGEKAKIMKKLFIENGFKIVYDMDDNAPIADGFYFTLSYPNYSGEELIEEFLYYGISAISLTITGSERKEGLRACVSLISREQFPDLEHRLKKFHEHHPIN